MSIKGVTLTPCCQKQYLHKTGRRDLIIYKPNLSLLANRRLTTLLHPTLGIPTLMSYTKCGTYWLKDVFWPILIFSCYNNWPPVTNTDRSSVYM